MNPFTKFLTRSKRTIRYFATRFGLTHTRESTFQIVSTDLVQNHKTIQDQLIERVAETFFCRVYLDVLSEEHQEQVERFIRFCYRLNLPVYVTFHNVVTAIDARFVRQCIVRWTRPPILNECTQIHQGYMKIEIEYNRCMTEYIISGLKGLEDNLCTLILPLQAKDLPSDDKNLSLWKGDKRKLQSNFYSHLKMMRDQ